ncbi:hypothetical protein AMAG_05889 [Allomyces macrogynus ATCC 38327]|uniref:Uncharacterized protein n=1 Tax=Allomyces macrogynus (strain ATCC 38327) TaxID=578462 RepID=A0A0L0SDF3_ALLM3|nr:hypothetical protein AMAG_05889 [Allomyces macrogynus ATCC 38327]|eukprot:KNE60506.1 hypothetical protein AMAG_05889 [Allomyces macrogynus ATCC 38327]
MMIGADTAAFLFLYEMVAQWVMSGSRLAPPPEPARVQVEEEVPVSNAEIVPAVLATNNGDGAPGKDVGASLARIASAVPASFDVDDRACASPAALLPAPIVQFETASASEALPADRPPRTRRPRSVARRQHQQQQSGCVPLQVCVAWMLALGARAAAAARTG